MSLNIFCIGRLMKLCGNVNRIKEMKEAGLGNNAIAGMFQDYGIDVKPEHIDPILYFCEVGSSIALPKKASKDLIKHFEGLSEGPCEDFEGFPELS
ncbi:MAG: hypothetical protein J6P00_02220 [Acetobacter sp.]|nr:hypothetical protein [Acetobacter sp.]